MALILCLKAGNERKMETPWGFQTYQNYFEKFLDISQFCLSHGLLEQLRRFAKIGENTDAQQRVICWSRVTTEYNASVVGVG